VAIVYNWLDSRKLVTQIQLTSGYAFVFGVEVKFPQVSDLKPTTLTPEYQNESDQIKYRSLKMNQPNAFLLETLFDKYKLSRTQLKVAMLMLESLSNQDIADKLGIALNSVKFHITYIFKKTGLKSRPEFITNFLPQYVRLQILDEVLHTLETAESHIKTVKAREARLISEYEGRLIMAKCRQHLKAEMIEAFHVALADLPVNVRETKLREFLTLMHLSL